MVTDFTHDSHFETTVPLKLSIPAPPVPTDIISYHLPDDSRELIILGQECLKNRLVSEAEKCFATALVDDASLTAAHYWLGYLYSRQGRYAEASLELKTCLAAQPRNGRAYAELGLVYFKMGHIREARALWQQGLWLTSCSDQSLTELLEHMSFCVTLDGEDKVVPNLCRMALLMAEKDVTQAYSYLERAQNLDPFNPTVFVASATVLEAVGCKEDAGRAWLEAVRLCPQDHSLKAKLAEFYFNQDKKEEAKAWAKMAVDMAPNDGTYRLLLAQVEISLGHFEEAEQQLRIAQRLEPEQANVNFELGHLLWYCYQSPLAFPFLRKAARAGHKKAKDFLSVINKEPDKKNRLTKAGNGGAVVEQIAY